jgi:deoxyribose-phosphate aldolase
MGDKKLDEFNNKFKTLANSYRDKNLTRKTIVSYIDHTLLKQNTTRDDIVKLTNEARKYKFIAVCVNPYYVSLAKKELLGSPVLIVSVIGFPLGATSNIIKIKEAARAIKDGANEIDMVMNNGAFKDHDYNYVEKEIKSIVLEGAKVKVIIETCLLTDEEKILATKIVKNSGAAYIKTSTGFNSAGATVRDVSLLKFIAGNDLEVKASGGIRDYETAKRMIFAGATRIGVSEGIRIIGE